MFEALSNRLQEGLKKLRGQAYINEKNISEALDNIRLALLEADVDYTIANELIEQVKIDALGQKVLRSVTPGQQIVKIFQDRLSELMGAEIVGLKLSKKPSIIVLAGLHGSGKTTTSAKLAYKLKREGKKCMLVAADIYRPAAIEQLEALGKSIEVPVYTDRSNPRVETIVREAKEKAKLEDYDVLIVDSAGRFQIDQEMIKELISISQMLLPTEILLVVDAALGQESISVAKHFNDALHITGAILTKVDGDARGGAAISIRKVANCPIKYIGTGEKIEDFEPFHPDRIASRILGMGDIVTLVEKASEELALEEAEALEKKLKSNKFDFNDFLKQIRQMRRIGGLNKILKLLPGGNNLSKMQVNDKELTRIEAIINSMTKEERRDPSLLNPSRKQRIAKGAGVSLQSVNALVKQFTMMKKFIKNPSMINGIMGNLGMPSMPAGFGNPIGAGVTRGPRTVKKKVRKKKKNAGKKRKKK